MCVYYIVDTIKESNTLALGYEFYVLEARIYSISRVIAASK